MMRSGGGGRIRSGDQEGIGDTEHCKHTELTHSATGSQTGVMERGGYPVQRTFAPTINTRNVILHLYIIFVREVIIYIYIYLVYTLLKYP